MEENIPEELRYYFSNITLNQYPESRIRPLSMYESIELHKELIEYEPIYRELGLFPLDDAQDSNPYCYVSKTPMKGCIFHYIHDDLPLFKFSNISNWANALNKTGESSKDIDDTNYEARIDAKDIIQLCRYIDSSYDSDKNAYSESTVYLIQGLDEHCFTLIEKLSKNSNLFMREAVAKFIGDKPSVTYTTVAETLAGDHYDQVSRLAKRALKEIHKRKDTQ